MSTKFTNITGLGRFGQLLLALLLIYSTVMHFKFSRFVAGIVPAWIPWHLFWVYFTGIALFAVGLSILVGKQVRLAASLLGLMLFLFVLFIHAPSMMSSIVHKPEDFNVLWSFNGTGGVNNALKDIALALSAFMLACLPEKERSATRERAGRTLVVLFAAVMVLFGVEHFFYTNYTPGIPSCTFVSFWIPWRSFWGYASGAALLVTGILILTKRQPRTAATVLGFTILIIAVPTYALRMFAHFGNYGELTNTVKDIALAGGAFLAGEITSRNQAYEENEGSQLPADVETAVS